jgi:TIR domain-containing protein
MKVFLSHAHADTDLARRVGDALEDAGLEVWDAERDVLPGDNLALEAGQALQDSDAMVVLLTPAGVRSRSVRADLEYALGEKIFKDRLVPLIVGTPQELPDEELPWILKRLQTVRLGPDDKEGLRRVASLLTETI